MRKVLVLLIATALVGCAAPAKRYLSAEQDAEMRQNCEPHGGCVVVPVPLWSQIEAFIARHRGTRI